MKLASLENKLYSKTRLLAHKTILCSCQLKSITGFIFLFFIEAGRSDKDKESSQTWEQGDRNINKLKMKHIF